MARLSKEMGLDEASLNQLKQHHILTVTDYLLEDTEKISSISNISFKDVLEIRQYMITNFSALPINGTFAYQNVLSKSALIPTGVASLDSLLQGGFLTGSIVEFCGQSGEGKTQLCLTIAAHVATVLKQPVCYIDTNGDFPSLRVQSIMQHRNVGEEDVNSSMDRIHVTRVKDMYQVIRFLHQLRKSLTEDDSPPPRVIIIDSVPALYFPFMGSEDNSRGFGLLNHLMATMKIIATEFHILFIEVNLASTSWEAEGCDTVTDEQAVSEMRPMLGKYWLHAPNTRILVSRLNIEAPQRLLRIIKSTYLPVGANCVVCVNQQGVV